MAITYLSVPMGVAELSTLRAVVNGRSTWGFVCTSVQAPLKSFGNCFIRYNTTMKQYIEIQSLVRTYFSILCSFTITTKPTNLVHHQGTNHTRTFECIGLFFLLKKSQLENSQLRKNSLLPSPRESASLAEITPEMGALSVEQKKTLHFHKDEHTVMVGEEMNRALASNAEPVQSNIRKRGLFLFAAIFEMQHFGMNRMCGFD